jgi:hypothetical protein
MIEFALDQQLHAVQIPWIIASAPLALPVEGMKPLCGRPARSLNGYSYRSSSSEKVH